MIITIKVKHKYFYVVHSKDGVHEDPKRSV